MAYRISADQLEDEYKDRPIVSAGLSGDIALNGGIPFGVTMIIAAPSKLGKTSFILKICENAQHQFGTKCFFFPIEGRLRPQFLEHAPRLKKDLDHFEIVLPDPIKEGGKIVGYQKWTAQQWWDEIGKTLEDNFQSILVIDSLSQLTPAEEFSEEMGKQTRGRQQSLEAQFCRKYGDIISARQNIIIFITQVQANTSGYGKSILPKVGNAIKHQGDILLMGKKKEPWKEKEVEIGCMSTFEVEFSALGAPSVFRIPIRYGHGYDIEQDIIDNAINIGMIKASKSWYTIPFEEGGDSMLPDEEVMEKGKKLQGTNGIRNYFEINQKQLKILQEKVKKIILI